MFITIGSRVQRIRDSQVSIRNDRNWFWLVVSFLCFFLFTFNILKKKFSFIRMKSSFYHPQINLVSKFTSIESRFRPNWSISEFSKAKSWFKDQHTRKIRNSKFNIQPVVQCSYVHAGLKFQLITTTFTQFSALFLFKDFRFSKTLK